MARGAINARLHRGWHACSVGQRGQGVCICVGSDRPHFDTPKHARPPPASGMAAFLKPRLASLRPPREGSLLQLAARSYGRHLMKGQLPLDQVRLLCTAACCGTRFALNPTCPLACWLTAHMIGASYQSAAMHGAPSCTAMHWKQLSSTAFHSPSLQARAAFQELILDLQEAVLAETARFLIGTCEREFDTPQPEPGTPEAAQPSDLRAAGSALKASLQGRVAAQCGCCLAQRCCGLWGELQSCARLLVGCRTPRGSTAAVLPLFPTVQSNTIGVLNTGHSFNAAGLQRHALPEHLPPALTSSPFSWVTLDVRAMLAPAFEGAEAPAWVCAYLSLAPKYSPAGAVPLWAWLRAGGMLGRLLSAAATSVERR